MLTSSLMMHKAVWEAREVWVSLKMGLYSWKLTTTLPWGPHLELLALAGNRRLVEIIAGLRDQTRIIGLRSLADRGALQATAEEHRPILEALRARDAAGAKRLMTVHLEHTRGAWAGLAEPASAESASVGS